MKKEMSRPVGDVAIALSLECTVAAPLDARSVVTTKGMLLDSTSFGANAYNGMLVTVTNDVGTPANNGVYRLKDVTTKTNANSWEQPGTGGGGSTTYSTLGTVAGNEATMVGTASSNDLRFKKLVPGTNIVLTSTTDDVTITRFIPAAPAAAMARWVPSTAGRIRSFSSLGLAIGKGDAL